MTRRFLKRCWETRWKKLDRWKGIARIFATLRSIWRTWQKFLSHSTRLSKSKVLSACLICLSRLQEEGYKSLPAMSKVLFIVQTCWLGSKEMAKIIHLYFCARATRHLVASLTTLSSQIQDLAYLRQRSMEEGRKTCSPILIKSLVSQKSPSRCQRWSLSSDSGRTWSSSASTTCFKQVVMHLLITKIRGHTFFQGVLLGSSIRTQSLSKSMLVQDQDNAKLISYPSRPLKMLTKRQ